MSATAPARPDAERYRQIRALFLTAQERPADQRLAWLADTCPDPEVRAEVESLLAHVDETPILAEDVARGALEHEDVSNLDPLGLIGVTLDDRYRVEAHVAEGGFGHVYRATHLRWQRPVAVKVFKPFLSADDTELRAAFIKEGGLLTELSRKTTAIVQSYDIGTWQPARGPALLFTVLEWLDGRPLSALLREDAGPWPLERVLAVLSPVAGALAVAHSAGVAHRDIKPGNIFLVEEVGVPTVKLLDFGVAKVAAERARGFQSTGGKVTAFTLGYAAPEQIARSHGPTGPWTDVYALALVAAELLAGRRAYGDEVLQALTQARDPHRRPTPRTLGATVSDRVEAVFATALAVDPAARPQDAQRFWAALEAALAAPVERSEPATAELPTAPPPRPQRLGWVVGALVVVAAVVGWWLSH